uniref:Uncharacterized protein n=1 Tax=Arundo donax TaxID=35708 RepID=A0A0A9F0J1_ARUDO
MFSFYPKKARIVVSKMSAMFTLWQACSKMANFIHQ